MSIEKRQSEVDKNLDFFVGELPKLGPQVGKFALLHDRSIIGFFDTVPDAVKVGNERYPEGQFSVQQVTETPVDLGYFSHANRLGRSQ
jgi:hypothetical protein